MGLRIIFELACHGLDLSDSKQETAIMIST